MSEGVSEKTPITPKNIFHKAKAVIESFNKPKTPEFTLEEAKQKLKEMEDKAEQVWFIFPDERHGIKRFHIIPNHYQILGVGKNATEKELKNASETQFHQLHQIEETFKKHNQEYDESRFEYLSDLGGDAYDDLHKFPELRNAINILTRPKPNNILENKMEEKRNMVYAMEMKRKEAELIVDIGRGDIPLSLPRIQSDLFQLSLGNFIFPKDKPFTGYQEISAKELLNITKEAFEGIVFNRFWSGDEFYNQLYNQEGKPKYICTDILNTLMQRIDASYSWIEYGYFNPNHFGMIDGLESLKNLEAPLRIANEIENPQAGYKDYDPGKISDFIKSVIGMSGEAVWSKDEFQKRIDEIKANVPNGYNMRENLYKRVLQINEVGSSSDNPLAGFHEEEDPFYLQLVNQ